MGCGCGRTRKPIKRKPPRIKRKTTLLRSDRRGRARYL